MEPQSSSSISRCDDRIVTLYLKKNPYIKINDCILMDAFYLICSKMTGGTVKMQLSVLVVNQCCIKYKYKNKYNICIKMRLVIFYSVVYITVYCSMRLISFCLDK